MAAARASSFDAKTGGAWVGAMLALATGADVVLGAGVAMHPLRVPIAMDSPRALSTTVCTGRRRDRFRMGSQ
ncbi:MAG: hypothetical protein LH475_01495 [Cryobacterium sp.]|uniref:hypothetical protein n=1 Tax=unclassified Cryobacterium TaxID=2649013 RepID=UPI0018C97C9D|nr:MULTISPECIES: hypothetical protein [unclassified Cryobacterium]MCY7403303.1 hypothetical protein [Cryobacterium sp.]